MSGVLFVALLVSAIVTLLACPVIVFAYRNTVARVIQLGAEPSRSSESVKPDSFKLPAATLQSPALLIVARHRLKRVAVVYSAAGFGCAAVLTAAFLLEGGTKSYLAPVVFIMIFSWPIVLCWNQIVGGTARTRSRPYLIYAALLASLGLLNALLKPGGDPSEVPYAFLLANTIPTLLILSFTSAPIKTVGPCIFSCSLISVLGAWSTVHLVTTIPSAVLLLSKWTELLGLSPQGAVTFLVILSFAVFIPIGFAWMTLLILGYARHKFSDLSIRLDSIWLTIAFVQGILVCTSTPTSTGRGVAVALGAFPVYWLVRTAGLRLIRQYHVQELNSRVSLLYLRRFALRDRTERLFRATTDLWRGIGDVVLIGGPDLARSTIQPHSLLQFLLRKTSRSLIPSDDTMRAQIAHLPGAIDLDTRSRITDFLCTDTMWQKTVNSLMERADKIIADFRGLVAENTGSLYEIGQMVNHVALDRVVILTEGSESKRLIEQVVSASWKGLTSSSPNFGRHPSELIILDQAGPDKEPFVLLNQVFSLSDNSRRRAEIVGEAHERRSA